MTQKSLRAANPGTRGRLARRACRKRPREEQWMALETVALAGQPTRISKKGRALLPEFSG